MFSPFAHSTEAAEVPGGRLAALNQVLTSFPVKQGSIRVHEAAERGTVDLAAHRTVAVVDELSRAVEDEANGAAEA